MTTCFTHRETQNRENRSSLTQELKSYVWYMYYEIKFTDKYLGCSKLWNAAT